MVTLASSRRESGIVIHLRDFDEAAAGVTYVVPEAGTLRPNVSGVLSGAARLVLRKRKRQPGAAG